MTFKRNIYILVTLFLISCTNYLDKPLDMIRLYKSIDNELNYLETWDNGNNLATIHWGKVGLKGDSKSVKSGLFSNYRKSVQKEIDSKINKLKIWR